MHHTHYLLGKPSFLSDALMPTMVRLCRMGPSLDTTFHGDINMAFTAVSLPASPLIMNLTLQQASVAGPGCVEGANQFAKWGLIGHMNSQWCSPNLFMWRERPHLASWLATSPQPGPATCAGTRLQGEPCHCHLTCCLSNWNTLDCSV